MPTSSPLKTAYSALQEAAGEGDVPRLQTVLKVLLAQLPAIHSEAFREVWEGGDAMMRAVHGEHVECMQVLLRLCEPWQKHAALRTSAEFGRVKSLRFLLSQGIDPTRTNGRGDTALALAASRGQGADCVRELMEWSDINSQNDEGTTPLMHAAAINDLDALRLLLPRSNAQIVDDEGSDALSHAAGRNSVDCLRVLLSVCDPFKKDIQGDTSFGLAALMGSLASLQCLITHAVEHGLVEVSPIGKAASAGARATPTQQMIVDAMALAAQEERWACVDMLAPYAFREDVAPLFAQAGAVKMPQWAARQEHEVLREELTQPQTDPAQDAPLAKERARRRL